MHHRIASVNNGLVSDCSRGNIADLHVVLNPSKHFQDVTWSFVRWVRVSNSRWLYCRPSQAYMVIEKGVGCETLVCIKTYHVRSKWMVGESKENFRLIKSLSSYSIRTWARNFPQILALFILKPAKVFAAFL